MAWLGLLSGVQYYGVFGVQKEDITLLYLVIVYFTEANLQRQIRPMEVKKMKTHHIQFAFGVFEH